MRHPVAGILPVSAVVPVKNEEANLARCLAHLGGFAETVVVDSGSTDRTREIAISRGAHFIQFVWDGGFPKKRNWCLRNHRFRAPWVMFVDADEYVTEDLKAEIRRVLPSTEHAGFWITYENHFMGRTLKEGSRTRKLSLFRIGSGEYERIDEQDWSALDMEVHEHPVLQGTTGALRSPVVHQDSKGLKAYIARHNEYSSWEARRYLALRKGPCARWRDLTRRQRLKYRLLNNWLFAPAYFLTTFIGKLGFLDGIPGLVFAALKMYYFFQIKCKIAEASREGAAAADEAALEESTSLHDGAP